MPFGHFIQFNCDVALGRTGFHAYVIGVAFVNPSERRND